MISIKKSISVILILFTLLSSILITQAVKIDGIDKNNEWEGAKTLAFTSNNNGVQIGILSYIVDGFDVYLRLQLKDKSIVSADTEAGFIVCLEGEEVLRISLKEKLVTQNTDRYSVEAEIEYYEGSELCCEAKIGVKRGIGKSVSGTVCFLDNSGVKSNIHPFEIAGYEETITEKPEPLTKEKTTAEKTTKPKTTKEKTTKEKTTKEKTTKEKTTKEKTTKLLTTKPITEKTTKPKTVTTKVQERFDSYIPAAVEVTTENGSTLISVAGNTAPADIVTVSKVQYYFADNIYDNYNRGKVLKIAACAASGLGFLTIGIWAGVKNKPSAKKTEEKVEEESDKD